MAVPGRREMDCLAVVQAFCLEVTARRRRRAARDEMHRKARVAISQTVFELEHVDMETADTGLCLSEMPSSCEVTKK